MMWLLLGTTLFLAAGSRPEPMRLAFVGDLSFAGRNDDPGAILAGAREVLERSELAVGNVEGLLLAAGAPPYREARLDISADPRFARAFRESGFDLLGTANNHSWDAGARGVLEILEHLARAASAEMQTFGSAATEIEAYAPHRHASALGCVSFIPATLKSNRRPEPGAAVALYGAAGRPISALIELVKAERAAGCAPIVSVHWGREGRPQPDRGVVEVGRALADAGALLVIGHHAHVLQGIEWRGASVIAWSLGNFVFRNRDPDKRRTGVLEVELARGRDTVVIAEVALVPMTIDLGTFAPRPATDSEAIALLRIMHERSTPFGTAVHAVDGRLLFRRP